MYIPYLLKNHFNFISGEIFVQVYSVPNNFLYQSSDHKGVLASESLLLGSHLIVDLLDYVSMT